MKFIIIGAGCYGSYHSGQLYKAIQKGKLPLNTQLILVDRNAQPVAKSLYADKANFSFVQSDWQAFLQNFFSDPSQFDFNRDSDSVQIVPAPFAPHLMFDWLQNAVNQSLKQLEINNIEIMREGFNYEMGLPFESTDQNGNHYISRAGWLCPTTCIEPRLCPAVKGLRDWDLATDVRRFVRGEPVLPSSSAAPKLQVANLTNGFLAVLEKTSEEGIKRLNPDQFSGVETFACHHFVHGIGTIPAYRLFEARQRVVAAALTLNANQPVTRIAVATVSHCHGVVAILRLTHISTYP